MAREASSTLRHEARRLLGAPFAALRSVWHRARPPTAPEAPDIATGHVLALVLGWALFVAVALGGFGWYTLTRVKLGSPSQDVSVLPSPRLQVDPASDYDRLTAMQRKRLASYAWADRATGTVEIPIERAMAIIAAKGADAFAPLAGPPADTARTRAVEAATQAGAAR